MSSRLVARELTALIADVKAALAKAGAISEYHDSMRLSFALGHLSSAVAELTTAAQVAAATGATVVTSQE